MTEKKQLAKEGELRFAAEFIRKGWNVFLPYGEDTPVDILIEKEKQYQRIQVKATRPQNGVLHCRLRSSNNWQIKKYSKNEIDAFGIYDAENKRGYLLPIETIPNLAEAILRLTKPKNNQKKNIRNAEDCAYF